VQCLMPSTQKRQPTIECTGCEFRWRSTHTGDSGRSRRLASPGIAAPTSSSALPRRAGRAGTRHWTRLRSSHVRRQACGHPTCSRVSAAIRTHMKVKTKQIIALFIMVIFYSPFIYFGAIKNLNNIDFGSSTLLWYLFGLISFPVIYFVLGKEVFQKTKLWEKDGYTGFWEWIKHSKSFTARIFRWGNIFALLIIIFSLFAVI